MKTILAVLLFSAVANADMYFECKKTSETEPVNSVSSAPGRIDLSLTDNYDLRLNGKKVRSEVVNDKKYSSPVLRSERLFLGELMIATYSFDGSRCDSEQEGHLTRLAQIGAEDVTETAEYDCVCGED